MITQDFGQISRWSSRTSDDQLSSVDFAKWIIDHNQALINLVDTKAGVILAADGAILALLAGSSFTLNSILDQTIVGATLLLIGLSALFGFLVIKPRVFADTPPTKIFFGSILTKKREEYLGSFRSTPNQILEDCVNNIYTLALIQRAKFTFLRKSLYCLLLGLAPLIGMIILLHT